MKTLKMSCYDNFRCVGGECPLTCCEFSWNIDIDKETEKYYRSVEGPFGEELKANMVDHEGRQFFHFEEGFRCHFLREDGLCRIVLELGDDKLGGTCKYYPRFYKRSEHIAFRGMNISCPEVGRLILKRDKFCIEQCDNLPGALSRKSDGAGSDTLFEAYKTAFGIIRDHSVNVRQRICALILYADQLQECLDVGEDPSALMSFFSEAARYVPVLHELGDKKKDVKKRIELLSALARITISNAVHTSVLDMLKCFTERLESSGEEIDRLFIGFDESIPQEEQENLMVYLLFLYMMKEWEEGGFLKAVLFSVIRFLLYETTSVLCAKEKGLSCFEERILQLAIQERIIEHNTVIGETFSAELEKTGRINPDWLLEAVC
ncbi:MAG: flagellin lysine-N-methylase [Lachnospiraceae bacterium]|nr:flagellin lysine-N-methylase [Lachnospiraceae bacterium]